MHDYTETNKMRDVSDSYFNRAARTKRKCGRYRGFTRAPAPIQGTPKIINRSSVIPQMVVLPGSHLPQPGRRYP